MDTTTSSTGLLGQVMSAASLRHRVIAQNIANVNTHGYRRLEVAFEDELAKALGAGGNAAAVRPRVVETGDVARVDGNTVDIDQELNALSRNSLVFQAAAQVVTLRLGQLRSAISGR